MNRYPEIKKFIKEDGGVDQYYNVKVKYISGHNPDLVIDGRERIDLTKYKTYASLHDLLQSKGFVKKTTEL